MRLILVALLSGLLGGCVVATAPYYPGPVVVREPPPPLRYEYPGYPPVAGHLWIGGNWAWVGQRYEWRPGRWSPPRAGYRWTAPRWERDGRHWREHEGRWEQDRHRHVVPEKRYSAPRDEYRERRRDERRGERHGDRYGDGFR
jgi:hypothetical protein